MKNCNAGKCKEEFCGKAAKAEGAKPEAEECCAPKKEAKGKKASKGCGCK